ncbi:GNAT family N-acetyltransferase [Flavivirga sp. 57AJ16]|uniref:GNAT family N-acetyltransferase n=1 Tax=Flavivirga sp. 57AJ16 TaxID=3025307 RepID=UPI0023656D02|nr:GNAT family N-acetyltransferase [Flavivirga sp. 57AJ16]MDD7886188.1 GNAT family N-acetyltransferase [Flavivirga sp. 57AJ16]
MKSKVFNNLFEFWGFVADKNQFLFKNNQYYYSLPKNGSWPKTIFKIDSKSINLNKLKSKITIDEIPNSICVPDDYFLELILKDSNFYLKSEVKAMVLDAQSIANKNENFESVQRVKTDKEVKLFSKIASKSFRYNIPFEIFKNLIKYSNTIELYIQKYKNEYVSCGLIFIDELGNVGLHMIGTLENYRGFGLGKIMTNKLLFEAKKYSSNHIVLVASESGEKIYSKIGFQTYGVLKTFAL